MFLFMPQPIWTDYYDVHIFEQDSRGRMTVAAICRYLQESAENHARDLGFSIAQLAAQDLTWVLLHLRLQFRYYPQYGDRVRLETWPSGLDARFAYRDFLLFTEKDPEPFGRCLTSWMVLARSTNRPVRTPDGLKQMPQPDRPHAILDGFPKLLLPETPGIVRQFPVRLHDLDVNQHVNNVHYIEWVTEAVPAEVYEKYLPVEVQITFRSAAMFGETVLCHTAELPGDAQGNGERQFLHHQTVENGTRELVRARTLWRPN